MRLSVSSPLAVRVGPNDRVITVLIQSEIAKAMTWTVFRCQPEPSFSIRIYLQLVLEIISFVLHMNCFDIIDDGFNYIVSVRWYPFYYQTNSLNSNRC